MAFRLRRGTDLQRQSITPAEGELIYVTDTKEIYAGDGTTLGGILVTGDIAGSPPELTRNLDTAGYTISGNGTLNLTGTITATAFVGDGSGLTNLPSTGTGVIEGQEYNIDIQGSVRGSDSTTLVDANTNSLYGNFIGDGSQITDMTLNQLDDVATFSPGEGEVLKYIGGFWTNSPETPGTGTGIIEGQAYLISIQGDVVSQDSSVIVDTSTNTFTGNFSGDGSDLSDVDALLLDGQSASYYLDYANATNKPTIPTDINQLTDVSGLLSVGLIEGQEYPVDIQGSVRQNDSTIIVDASTGFITTPKITGTTALQIDNGAGIDVLDTSDFAAIRIKRLDPAVDISPVSPPTAYGTIQFQRDDINGLKTGVYVQGGSDGFKVFNLPDGSTFNALYSMQLNMSGNLGIGTAPATKLHVKGHMTLDDNRAYTAVTPTNAGELMFDAVTDDGALYLWTGGEWAKIVQQGLTSGATILSTPLLVGGVDNATRDAFGEDSSTIDGAILYNTDEDRVQFFQAGSWITLPNNGTEAGQVLTWDGAKWEATAPATGGSVVSADQLDGFDGPYYLNWNNFTNTPTTLAGYGITDSPDLGAFEFTSSTISTTDSSDITITQKVSLQSDLVVDGRITGTIEFSTISALPTTLAEHGITDGVTLTQLDSLVGNFNWNGNVMDTEDSTAIVMAPAVVINSDLTVENDLIVNNKIVADTIEVNNLITTPGAGTPEIESDGAILLTAGTRVEISSSPLKMASFTTAERDLLSAENGDMIYNTTTNKFQGYANSTWVDLH